MKTHQTKMRPRFSTRGQAAGHGRIVTILAIPTLMAVLVLMAPPTPVAARQDSKPVIEQSVSATYGSSLTFTLSVNSSVPLAGARLTIQIANRDSVYTQAVPIQPGQQAATTHSIAPQDINLPPFALLTYYWDVADQNGQEYRSDPATMRYEDTSVPWQWAAISDGGIVIHTDGSDPAISEAALNIAREGLAEASRLTGIVVQDELHVYIYPELAQMAGALRLHGVQVSDWVAAYAVPEQRIAIVTASPGPEMLVNLRRDLPHEIAHLVVGTGAGQNADSVPGWFNEGLALLNTPEPDPTLYSTLTDSLTDDPEGLHDLATLCVPSFGNLPPHDAALAYAQSESLMRFVASRYGTSQVRMLMSAYAEGLSCEGAVTQVLGLTLDDLEQAWRGDMARSGISVTQLPDRLIPWLVVWAVSLSMALLFVAPQPLQIEDDAPADKTRLALPKVPDT